MSKNHALFADSAFMRAVFETVGSLIVVMERDGKVVYFNPACEQATGFSAEEIVGGEIWNKLIPAEMCEAVKDVFANLAAGDFPSTYDNPWLTKDGELRQISWSNTAMVDEAGAVTHVIGTGVDITERVQTMQRLSVSENRARDVLENIKEVFWVGTPDWREVLYVSPTFEDMWGRSCQSLYDNPHRWIEGVHPDDQAAVLADIEKKSGGDLDDPFFPEYRVVRPDGEMRWVLARAFPVKDDDGKVLRIVGLAEDITALKASQAELTEAKDRAEQANAAKSKFLAAASHDLRQPLQAMRLFIYALEQALKNPAVAQGQSTYDLVHRLEDSVEILGGLLNALLDISKLEAGVVEPTLDDLPVGRLLSNARARFSIEAQDKGIDLRILPCSLQVHTDPALLGSIIDNLMSNALRYTEHGKVLLGVRRCGDTARVEVWDTGVGISETKLEHVFDEFVQLANPARERSKGLGLGLSIVRRLANLLDHKLEVRSQLGKGSVFAVSVPVAETAEPPKLENLQHGRDVDPGDAKTILIIEDDQLVLHATASLVNSWGHHVILAASASVAMEKVAKMARGPDLMIIDYRLPGHWTGLDAYRGINAHFGGGIPGIIISGDTSPELLQEFKDSGLPFLTKPIDPRALERCLPVLLK